MNEVFQTNKFPYNLRNPRLLASKHKSTIKHDTRVFKVPQIWQGIPLDIRNSESLILFKSNIKRCKICRSFIESLEQPLPQSRTCNRNKIK